MIPTAVKKEIIELLSNPNQKCPESEWQLSVDLLFSIEIILRRLKAHNIIDNKQDKEIRLKLKNLTYCSCLNAPHLKDNYKIKKLTKILCLNDFIHSIGFSKDISIVDCIDSA